MGSFKGTPGPWLAIQQYEDSMSVTDSQGFEVVTAEGMAILADWDEKGFSHWSREGGYRELTVDEQFANAYLISAAPELLEALQELSSRAEIYVNTSKAKEAIAKALGK